MEETNAEAERGREFDNHADDQWGVAHERIYFENDGAFDGAFGKEKLLIILNVAFYCSTSKPQINRVCGT